jgi:hypothetical protein
MKLMFVFLAMFAFQALASDATLIYEAQKKGISLTDNDKEVIEIGEISTTRYIVGGVLGTYPLGLGIGHAVQGRWSQKGWIFTAGELGSLAVAVVGLSGCTGNLLNGHDCSGINSTLIGVGIVGVIGFRIWEIIDVWAVPPGHNKKFKELKNYIEKDTAKPEAKVSLDLVPVMRPGMGNGLALRLNF